MLSCASAWLLPKHQPPRIPRRQEHRIWGYLWAAAVHSKPGDGATAADRPASSMNAKRLSATPADLSNAVGAAQIAVNNPDYNWLWGDGDWAAWTRFSGWVIASHWDRYFKAGS